MKKTLKKGIGTAMAMAGLFLAVCTMDGSDYETALRFCGVVMTALGAWMAEAFDFQTPPAPLREGEGIVDEDEADLE